MSKEPRQRGTWTLRGVVNKLQSLVSGSKTGSASDSATAPARLLRRDFCFNTASGALFFCQRREFCDRWGFQPGDLVAYGAHHPLHNWRATIVGERGGILWACDEGSQLAHPLHCATPTAAALVAKYGFTKVGVNRDLQAAPVPAQLTLEHRQQLCALPDLLVRVNDGKQLMHLSPCVSADSTIGWAGVGYVDNGSAPQELLSICATAAL